MTEKVRAQQRYFCGNCQREVFFVAKYCDKCGGELEWPEKVQKVISSWKKSKEEKD